MRHYRVLDPVTFTDGRVISIVNEIAGKIKKKPAFLWLNKKAFDTGAAEAKKAKAEMEG